MAPAVPWLRTAGGELLRSIAAGNSEPRKPADADRLRDLIGNRYVESEQVVGRYRVTQAGWRWLAEYERLCRGARRVA